MTMFKSTKRLLAVLLAPLALFAFALPAQAGTATSNLSVSATVSNNCSISTSPVAFGAYDPITANASTALDAAGSVTVTCTSGASATITLGQGASADTGSTDAAPLRRMVAGTTNFLSYSLFQETGRTTAWGNTAGTGVAHTGTGSSTTIDVFGRVAAGQQKPAGSYADTVVATITF